VRAVVPGWLRQYRREWLGADAIAGLIIWSVVTPQCVAYAQIAGLPPQAGLMAAPGAMIGYALLGTSRSLVVSATSSTAAVSAAAIGTLAGGSASRVATLSAALALLTGVVLVGAGILRLGGVADLISKPVMTGFLFGLGLTIAMGQLPKVFGVPAGNGNFFAQLAHLIGHLGSTHAAALAVGAASIAVLFAFKRMAPALPGTLIVLAVAIVVSSLFHLSSHGVAVVGKLPSALPHLAFPSVGAHEFVNLLPAAFGVMLMTTEGLGVARAVASRHAYSIDASRELIAVGGGNVLAGLSQGFVQAGGSSQTAAADEAGGKTQLASIVAAGLILLTGAFLAPVFKNLPEATLGAIVVVAVTGFFRVDELRRFARLRRSALVLSLVSLVGVLALGVLPGLIVAVGLALMLVIYRLSRPSVGALARDPESGAWGRCDRHPGWSETPGNLVVRSDGPLFYANTQHFKQRTLGLVAGAKPQPRTVVLDLAENGDLDIETLDALGELRDELDRQGIELRLVSARARALKLLAAAGLADEIRIDASLDAAVADSRRLAGAAARRHT